MTENTKSRRELFKKSILAAGTVVSTSFLASGLKASEMCGLTPAQPEGPFYPIADQFDKDNDLTHVHGKSTMALGEVVILEGKVMSNNCSPLKGALVEIWQACASGKYNHPGDPNDAKLDPNFQYWGRAITNEKGQYSFKTIIPGEYVASGTWIRPPHIHLKCQLRGYNELTTQVYFEQFKKLNNRDLLLKQLTMSGRSKVIVKFLENNNGPRTGVFNISLNQI